MKKIIFSIMAVFIFLLTGCKVKDNSDPMKQALSNLDSLSSYELSCEMTIYRSNKDVHMDINVIYLNPGYYRVSFKNTGNEQIIVKNDEGVFVLTPALNKEFKFDSEWPMNSSHAYLIDCINKIIKADSDAKYVTEGDEVTISAKLNDSNDRAKKLIFVYNTKTKMPVKATFVDENDKNVVVVSFKKFNENKDITKDKFNTKLIMEEKINETENTSGEEKTLTVVVGYSVDGVKLTSTKIKNNTTVLCYRGSKNYTIVVKKIGDFEDVTIDKISSVDFIDYGIITTNSSVSKFYIENNEISIYGSNLTNEEIITIASEITMS